MEREIIREKDIQYLARLIKALEEKVAEMENAYKKSDIPNFSKSKKAILQIQNRISRVLR